MIKIDTSSLVLADWDPQQIHYIYNGLDVLMTHEIWGKQQARADADPYTRDIYNFEQALLEPAILMGRHGVRVDMKARERGIRNYTQKIYDVGGLARDREGKWRIINEDAPLQRVAQAVWDRTLNPNSSPQLADFFYDKLKMVPIFTRKKGITKGLSTDREALERMMEHAPRAVPPAALVLATRDYMGILEMLERGVDSDGRMRYSLNVAGTETFRLSSNKDPFRMGGNIQNVPMDLRHIFIPDEGCVAFGIDKSQAESRGVAYLSGDENYIAAVEGPDLHTDVAKMVWPAIVFDRATADAIMYRTYTYRFMSKKGSHATNYLVTPYTMARALKIEKKVAEDFQDSYFEAFPGVKKWQEDTIKELMLTNELVTPLGQRRHFWGRASDGSTQREAIAFKPQAMISADINVGILDVWDNIPHEFCRPQAQVHDAVYGSIPINMVDKIMPEILERLVNPIQVNGRTMRLPVDAKVGMNWAEQSATNAEGLKKWKAQ